MLIIHREKNQKRGIALLNILGELFLLEKVNSSSKLIIICIILLIYFKLIILLLLLISSTLNEKSKL